MFGRRGEEALGWAQAFDALRAAHDETTAALRARIADLERQLATATSTPAAVPTPVSPEPPLPSRTQAAIVAEANGNPALLRLLQRAAWRKLASGADDATVARAVLTGDRLTGDDD